MDFIVYDVRVVRIQFVYWSIISINSCICITLWNRDECSCSTFIGMYLAKNLIAFHLSSSSINWHVYFSRTFYEQYVDSLKCMIQTCSNLLKLNTLCTLMETNIVEIVYSRNYYFIFNLCTFIRNSIAHSVL